MKLFCYVTVILGCFGVLVCFFFQENLESALKKGSNFTSPIQDDGTVMRPFDTIPAESVQIIPHVKGKIGFNCKHSSCQIIAKDSTEAQFPNGAKALFQYLSTHLQYPPIAREGGIEGTVYLNFIVAKNGALEDITVMRGVSGGCTEVAVRVVQAMPKWIPATKNGQKVCSRYILPVKIKLD